MYNTPSVSSASSSSSSTTSSREDTASPPLDLSHADASQLAAELAAILGETPDSASASSVEDAVPLGPALKQLSQSPRPPPELLLSVVKHLDQLVEVLVTSGRTPSPKEGDGEEEEEEEEVVGGARK